MGTFKDLMLLQDTLFRKDMASNANLRFECNNLLDKIMDSPQLYLSNLIHQDKASKFHYLHLNRSKLGKET